jgi:hypothetical protein
MQLTLDTEVTDATDDELRVASTITDTKVLADSATDPKAAAALREEMSGMVGLAMTMRISRRGVVRQTDVSTPARLDPRVAQMLDGVKQSMSQLGVPFPEEPIGQGARWQVVASHHVAFNATDTSVIELDALNGDRGTTTTKISISAQPQIVTTPGAPAGAVTKLTASHGEGEVRTSFDLSHVMPLEAKARVTSETSMNVTAGGKSQDMKMKSEMTMESSTVSAGTTKP